jgi:hypothetical protein
MLFLFFFKPRREEKRAFNNISLKQGVQILTITTLLILTVYFIADLIFTDFDLFAIIKNSILSFLNIVAGAFLFISTFRLNLKNAKRGYYILSFSFILHVMVIFTNSCMLAVGLKIYNFVNWECLMFFTLLSAYELYYLWIVYNYTSHLSKGNDALVDGFNFDKFVENFGSANNSFSSSVKDMKP